MMSKVLKGILPAVSVLLVVLGAFTKTSSAAPVPLLKIEEPVDGQVVESFVVNLKFSLKNFTLKNFNQFPKNNPNQGHLHIWLDKDTPTKDNAIMYYKVSPYTFADVEAGKHTLKVELVNNDHTSFDPQIIQTIKFETKAPAGSEAEPLKPADIANVAVSKSGEVPDSLNNLKGPNYVMYLVFGLGALIVGLLGAVFLRR